MVDAVSPLRCRADVSGTNCNYKQNDDHRDDDVGLHVLGCRAVSGTNCKYKQNEEVMLNVLRCQLTY